MTPETWRAVADLAATQHGLIASRQLERLGVGRRSIERARERQRVVSYRRGVYLLAGTPADVWQPLMAALLLVDGVASHRAAAALHGFPGVMPGAVEFTVFDATTPRVNGAVAHRSSVLYVDDLAKVGGFDVTAAARTLVDLAAYRDIDTSLLRRMLDDCAVRRLCLPNDVAASLERCGTHRRGSVRLRRLVEERVRSDSHLEQVWLRRLLRAGLRPPEVGYQLVVDGSVLVLDFAWPEHRVAVEVDGWRPHATRRAFDHDRLRDLAAVRAGWTVLRVTSRTPPAHLFATIRQLISQYAPSEGAQVRNQRKGEAARAMTAVPAITR